MSIVSSKNLSPDSIWQQIWCLILRDLGILIKLFMADAYNLNSWFLASNLMHQSLDSEPTLGASLECEYCNTFLVWSYHWDTASLRLGDDTWCSLWASQQFLMRWQEQTWGWHSRTSAESFHNIHYLLGSNLQTSVVENEPKLTILKLHCLTKTLTVPTGDLTIGECGWLIGNLNIPIVKWFSSSIQILQLKERRSGLKTLTEKQFHFILQTSNISCIISGRMPSVTWK